MSTSSKEPTLSPEVADLKVRATKRFKAGKFKQARTLYNEAIALEKSSPALYSNRSAANIKLSRYEDALKDAEKVIQLDPKWEKGPARLAIAQEYLARYQAAYESYLKAASVASDPNLQQEYADSAERVKAQVMGLTTERNQSARLLPADTEDPFSRLDRLERQGYTYGPASAARRYALVSEGIKDSWRTCQKLTVSNRSPDGRRLPNGEIWINMPRERGVYGIMLEHVARILQDPTHSFCYPYHREWRNPVELVNAMCAMYTSFDNVLREPNASPAKWIRHIDSLRQRHGWESIDGGLGARSIMTGQIRFKILSGIVQELVVGDAGTALEHYNYAYTMINLARRQWPHEIGAEGCGTSMTRTFRRGVYTRILTCTIAVAQNLKYPEKKLREIEAIANELLESCESHSIPQPPEGADAIEFVTWIAFDTWIRAEAYMAIALVHRMRAEGEEGKRLQSTYYDTLEARIAMDNYLKAASWYSEDDQQFAQAVWCALEMQMRIGGMSLQAMDAMIAIAKKAEEDYERFHGPEDWSRQVHMNRTFALNHRNQLAKEAKKRGITDPAKIILNPVPRVVTSTSRAQSVLRGNDADAPAVVSELEQGGDDSARFTIAQVFSEAQRRRADATKNMPAVFVDD